MYAPRRSHLLLAALMCLAAPAAADDFADFRIPDHGFLRWTGNVQGHVDWSRVKNLGTSASTGNSQVMLGTVLDRLRDSEALYSLWTLDLNGTASRAHSVSGAPAPLDREESGSQGVEEIASLAGTWRRFPARQPWFVTVTASASLDDQQDWSQAHQLRIFEPEPWLLDLSTSQMDRTYFTQVSGDLGVGLGRVRDATGIYDARVIEDRLQRAHALKHALSHAARQRLAGLFYARGDLETTLDRPATVAWEALERILREDDAVADSCLSARDLFRLVEPYMGRRPDYSPTALPRSFVLRQRGASLQAILTAASSHNIDDSDQAFTERSISSSFDDTLVAHSVRRDAGGSDALAGGIAADWHLPCGLRWQLDASGRAQWPMRAHKRGVSAASAFSVSGQVADRWVSILRASFRRTLSRPAPGFTVEDSWNWVLGAVNSYFVADHVSLDISTELSFSKQLLDDGSPLFPGPLLDQRGRYGQVNLSLTYRFAGYAVAPGLFSTPGSFAR